jgi:hypothetical protein
MTIIDATELLKAYKGPFKLTLHAGATDALISNAEDIYGLTLPDDFKTLYRFTDGFEIDEDILNLIPLKEIIANKEDGKSMWIAEYLIYSEMWELEINPDNPEDYSIAAFDMDKGKVILTRSLATFIERLLKGGVFETGGLYHWLDEIKSKLYGNTDHSEAKPLLGVFRRFIYRLRNK